MMGSADVRGLRAGQVRERHQGMEPVGARSRRSGGQDVPMTNMSEERREDPVLGLFGSFQRHQPGDRFSVLADDDRGAGGGDLIDERQALLLEFSGGDRLPWYVHGRIPWTKTSACQVAWHAEAVWRRGWHAG